MRNSVVALAAIGTVVAFSANAQSYPEQPIEVIVPYAAGGGTDLSMRVMAETLQKKIPGATVVIRNVPGGGGGIGTGEALKATPDGYTLGTGAQGPIALLPHYGATTYNIDDVDFLALMARNLQVVLACKDAPFTKVEEFLAYAKENPGMILIGNSGSGGANHLSVEAFGRASGTAFENVPFSGASEALTNCAGGHIDAVTATPAEARAHIESGAVTPLFVMEAERIAEFPDVPTAVESGVDFTWSSWKGIIAPKGLPEDVRTTLTAALKETFEDPEFIARMKEMGEFVDYRDSDGYAELARADSKMAEGVIRELGMYGMNK
ncbi:Bug family tripartite tricarboxylate transporter substrate binding protein [Falsirhodobacter sp. 20TX0035]|uniref:Bug family tripartite tricarboxylate transporter substrate binding protein n=1 Tax=Falsirhodobacter sp. 20TX0035 TaxID=3022019 RepID=UPI0023300DC2|nr:tripartite tricarboxylate transporter substrate binding protein [Falsirhodobacter sp. 20TX0035]MDB6454183.1 tripartite tricarboxylate transporter substrate binding protein [Falsirhodobacter sp. 20TX0035]